MLHAGLTAFFSKKSGAKRKMAFSFPPSEAAVSKYPFTGAARELLQEQGGHAVSFEALQAASAFCRSVISLSSQESFSRNVSSAPSRDAVANYALCRLLLSQIKGRPDLAQKFGRNFARLCAKRLEREEAGVFEGVFRDFFPSLSSAQAPFDYSVSFFDFLNSGGQLLYAQLDSGRVFLQKTGLLEIIEGAIEKRAKELPASDAKTIPEMVKEVAEELAQAVPIPREKVFAGKYSGKFLSLPCISGALAGVGEGRRYYGSMAVAIACVKDGLPKEQAIPVMQEYVSHCVRTAHEFSIQEGMASLDWVYKHPSMGFSCKVTRDQGLAGAADSLCVQCPFNRNKPPFGNAKTK